PWGRETADIRGRPTCGQRGRDHTIKVLSERASAAPLSFVRADVAAIPAAGIRNVRILERSCYAPLVGDQAKADPLIDRRTAIDKGDSWSQTAIILQAD